MRKLIAGIHRFRKQHWSENRELYRRLAEHGQFPEALFITCSDARVNPVTITHAQPGDLFIVRNMGNFVPPYTEDPLEGTGVAANYPELSREERYEITAEENVLLQMENLRTYPVVQKAACEGRLHVHAWYYVIGTGTVFRYSPEKEQFEPIREEE